MDVVKNNFYGNHKMFSIANKFLAYVDTKKMNWYLDRGLAVKVGDNDFKLNFKSKGDSVNGKYHYLSLENRCVICASIKDLTKHHVVPHQFRKYLPLSYKTRNSFDVLCLCSTCHIEYEVEADKLKNSLFSKYGLLNYDKEIKKILSYHTTLKLYSKNIPDERVYKIVEILEEYFDSNIEDILATEYEFESSTEKLIKNIENFEDFVLMWRKHFIKYAKPKFLPKEWYDEINIIQNSYDN